MDFDHTGSMTDRDCLLYIHERLRILLQEHPSMEYMRKLRGIIDKTDKLEDTEPYFGSITELEDKHESE